MSALRAITWPFRRLWKTLVWIADFIIKLVTSLFRVAFRCIELVLFLGTLWMFFAFVGSRSYTPPQGVSIDTGSALNFWNPSMLVCETVAFRRPPVLSTAALHLVEHAVARQLILDHDQLLITATTNSNEVRFQRCFRSTTAGTMPSFVDEITSYLQTLELSADEWRRIRKRVFLEERTRLPLGSRKPAWSSLLNGELVVDYASDNTLMNQSFQILASVKPTVVFKTAPARRRAVRSLTEKEGRALRKGQWSDDVFNEPTKTLSLPAVLVTTSPSSATPKLLAKYPLHFRETCPEDFDRLREIFQSSPGSGNFLPGDPSTDTTGRYPFLDVFVDDNDLLREYIETLQTTSCRPTVVLGVNLSTTVLQPVADAFGIEPKTYAVYGESDPWTTEWSHELREAWIQYQPMSRSPNAPLLETFDYISDRSLLLLSLSYELGLKRQLIWDATYIYLGPKWVGAGARSILYLREDREALLRYLHQLQAAFNESDKKALVNNEIFRKAAEESCKVDRLSFGFCLGVPHASPTGALRVSKIIAPDVPMHTDDWEAGYQKILNVPKRTLSHKEY